MQVYNVASFIWLWATCTRQYQANLRADAYMYAHMIISVTQLRDEEFETFHQVNWHERNQWFGKWRAVLPV